MCNCTAAKRFCSSLPRNCSTRACSRTCRVSRGSLHWIGPILCLPGPCNKPPFQQWRLLSFVEEEEAETEREEIRDALLTSSAVHEHHARPRRHAVSAPVLDAQGLHGPFPRCAFLHLFMMGLGLFTDRTDSNKPQTNHNKHSRCARRLCCRCLSTRGATRRMFTK